MLMMHEYIIKQTIIYLTFSAYVGALDIFKIFGSKYRNKQCKRVVMPALNKNIKKQHCCEI